MGDWLYTQAWTFVPSIPCVLKIGDFLIKDKTKRFNNMYLPEETCSLSDTAKIGQEKNKIKFKYLNFYFLLDNTIILRCKNVHAGLAQVI